MVAEVKQNGVRNSLVPETVGAETVQCQKWLSNVNGGGHKWRSEHIPSPLIPSSSVGLSLL